MPHSRLTIIILGSIAVILIIVTILLARNQLNGSPVITPTPSSPPQQISPTPQVRITETPSVNTGAKEDAPPDDILLRSRQSENLRAQLPFDGGQFQISFNYKDDVFEVQLVPPLEQSRDAFITWLQQNYSLIPITRFIIK